MINYFIRVTRILIWSFCVFVDCGWWVFVRCCFIGCWCFWLFLMFCCSGCCGRCCFMRFCLIFIYWLWLILFLSLVLIRFSVILVMSFCFYGRIVGFVLFVGCRAWRVYFSDGGVGIQKFSMVYFFGFRVFKFWMGGKGLVLDWFFWSFLQFNFMGREFVLMFLSFRVGVVLFLIQV